MGWDYEKVRYKYADFYHRIEEDNIRTFIAVTSTKRVLAKDCLPITPFDITKFNFGELELKDVTVDVSNAIINDETETEIDPDIDTKSDI